MTWEVELNVLNVLISHLCSIFWELPVYFISLFVAELVGFLLFTFFDFFVHSGYYSSVKWIVGKTVSFSLGCLFKEVLLKK